jgi:hypothetical protein
VTTRNLLFVLAILIGIVLVGEFVNWYLAAGTIAGVFLAIYLFYNRFSIFDEIETEYYWYVGKGWKDQPEEEAKPYWSEVWRPLLLWAALLVVLALIIAGVMG